MENIVKDSVMSRVYESHHSHSRKQGFCICGDERGEFFNNVIGKGKKVLDIGCRDGALTKYFISGNEVTGIDIDRNALHRAEKNLRIRTIHADLLSDWPIERLSFDVVSAGEVLEHVYFPEEIVKKIVAVLKNTGTFVGSVPNAFNLKNRLRLLFGIKRGTPLSDPTHINHFSVNEIKNLLSKYFGSIYVTGTGRYRTLSRLFPGLFAFDILFTATDKRQQ